MSERITTSRRENALRRHRPADDPELLAATTERKTAALAAHITKLVDAAPPLTAEQRDRLALLLRPSTEQRAG